jgi:F0F1-type ATP synthase assembly protein I
LAETQIRNKERERELRIRENEERLNKREQKLQKSRASRRAGQGSGIGSDMFKINSDFIGIGNIGSPPKTKGKKKKGNNKKQPRDPFDFF